MDYKREEYISVASDEESRKAGEGVKVKVTFLFKDFTPEQLVDRLMVSNSPKVSVQSVLRKMEKVPSEYTYAVPKAGQRAAIDPDTVINALSESEAEAAIAKLREKYGL